MEILYPKIMYIRLYRRLIYKTNIKKLIYKTTKIWTPEQVLGILVLWEKFDFLRLCEKNYFVRNKCRKLT